MRSTTETTHRPVTRALIGLILPLIGSGAMAWEGGCPTRPTGVTGSGLIAARTTDCPESTATRVIIRTAEFELGDSVVFLVGGHASKRGQELRLVDSSTGNTLPIRVRTDVTTRWSIKRVEVPRGWQGKSATLEGVDPEPGGSWIGFSAPLSPNQMRWLRWAPRLETAGWTALCLLILAILANWCEREQWSSKEPVANLDSR